MDRDELRDELLALVRAGRELPVEDDQHLVDTFLGGLQVSGRHVGGTRASPQPIDDWEFARVDWPFTGAVAFGVVAAVFALTLVLSRNVGAAFVFGIAVFILVSMPMLVDNGQFLRTDRRLVREERSWVRDDTSPEVVIRVYKHEQIQRVDARRMAALGYAVERREQTPRGARIIYRWVDS